MRYLRILTLHFQQVLEHRARNFVWFLIHFINPLILLMFWKGALASGVVVKGWNDVSIQTYYILLIVLQALISSHVESEVAVDDIQLGGLVRDLLKPFDYLWLKLFDEVPSRVLQGFYGCIVILIFYLFNFRLSISTNATTIAQSILICILAYLLCFLFKMVLALFAFWMTNVDGILETNDVLLLLLAGTLLPFDLLPNWIQEVARYTPYPYFVYYPVASFIGRFNSSELTRIISYECVWIVGFFAMYKIMWYFGVKRFSAIGQ